MRVHIYIYTYIYIYIYKVVLGSVACELIKRDSKLTRSWYLKKALQSLLAENKLLISSTTPSHCCQIS